MLASNVVLTDPNGNIMSNDIITCCIGSLRKELGATQNLKIAHLLTFKLQVRCNLESGDLIEPFYFAFNVSSVLPF